MDINLLINMECLYASYRELWEKQDFCPKGLDSNYINNYSVWLTVLKCYERTNQDIGEGLLDDQGMASWQEIIWAVLLLRMI